MSYPQGGQAQNYYNNAAPQYPPPQQGYGQYPPPAPQQQVRKAFSLRIVLQNGG
jgi:hypothetical protein